MITSADIKGGMQKPKHFRSILPYLKAKQAEAEKEKAEKPVEKKEVNNAE